jgi:hypothetical protein
MFGVDFCLLWSREVANLPYPTLCASSLSGYMFSFAKAETHDKVMFMQLCKAHASAASLTSCEP